MRAVVTGAGVLFGLCSEQRSATRYGSQYKMQVWGLDGQCDAATRA